MTTPVHPQLTPVALRALRPTQMTVGMAEVAAKQAEWRERPRDKAGRFLGSHMIPAVIGPHDEVWIVDHHHLALALLREGVDDVLIAVIARLDHLQRPRFLAFLDCHNWLHPYDQHGKRRDFADLPRHLDDLVDDPYRSLAGAVRRAGGYAKSPAPFSEFLWADYLRDHIARGDLDADFARAVARATKLARDRNARHLPGWAGAESD